MNASNTIAVLFVRKDNFILWTYYNNHRVAIQCQPNSKGRAPRTVKGAKCSFRYYAKKKKLRKFAFADMVDGIPVVQEELLSTGYTIKPLEGVPVGGPEQHEEPSQILVMDGVKVVQGDCFGS